MRKIFLFISILLFSNSNFAQEIIKLDEKYFIDFNEIFRKNGIIEIRELVNYGIEFEYPEPHNEEERSELIEKERNHREAFKIFKPKKGSYLLEGKGFTMRFEVNEKGEFIGITTIKIIIDSENCEMKFSFKNGRFTTANFKDSKGNTFITYEDIGTYTKLNQFNRDGKINLSIIVQKGDEYDKGIEIYYYPNGQIKSERDNKKMTYTSYYEDGSVEVLSDLNTNESITFDENGQKNSISYTIDNQIYFTDVYENGEHIRQHFTKIDSDITTTYYYKNDNLDYITIEDFTKNEVSKYDKNGILIETKNITPIPF